MKRLVKKHFVPIVMTPDNFCSVYLSVSVHGQLQIVGVLQLKGLSCQCGQVKVKYSRVPMDEPEMFLVKTNFVPWLHLGAEVTHPLH